MEIYFNKKNKSQWLTDRDWSQIDHASGKRLYYGGMAELHWDSGSVAESSH